MPVMAQELEGHGSRQARTTHTMALRPAATVIARPCPYFDFAVAWTGGLTSKLCYSAAMVTSYALLAVAATCLEAEYMQHHEIDMRSGVR